MCLGRGTSVKHPSCVCPLPSLTAIHAPLLSRHLFKYIISGLTRICNRMRIVLCDAIKQSAHRSVLGFTDGSYRKEVMKKACVAVGS